MAFLEIKADLTRTADALERIASALESMLPKPQERPKLTKIINVSQEAIAEQEEERNRKIALGLGPGEIEPEEEKVGK